MAQPDARTMENPFLCSTNFVYDVTFQALVVEHLGPSGMVNSMLANVEDQPPAILIKLRKALEEQWVLAIADYVLAGLSEKTLRRLLEDLKTNTLPEHVRLKLGERLKRHHVEIRNRLTSTLEKHMLHLK